VRSQSEQNEPVTTTDQPPPVRGLAPLYLAGFTTAFGAHGVGSVLGAETDDIGLSLVGLGIVGCSDAEP
jgi:hypothetical protein